MVMPTEEKLPSVRDLVESDSGPLRRFTGVLDSMPQEEQVWQAGTPDERKSMKLNLNYKDIEVIESVESYHFPIYILSLGLSNRKKSKYGVFGVSLAEILDQQYSAAQLDPDSAEYVKPTNRMDLKDCVGKRMGMVLADGPETGRPDKHLLFDGRAKDEEHPKGQDMPTAVWEVYMVEGVGVKGAEGQNPMETAIKLLDGANLTEFRTAAMASDLVRGDIPLLQSIGMPETAPNSFAATMITSGSFTKDENGVFHKV